MAYELIDAALRDLSEIFKGSRVYLPGDAFPPNCHPVDNPDPVPRADHPAVIAYHNHSDHGGCPQLGPPHTIAGQGAASLTGSSFKNKVTEQTTHKSCPKPVALLRCIEESDTDPPKDRGIYKPCGSWDCPFCSIKNAQKMRFKILVGLEKILQGVPEKELSYYVKFITLTAPGRDWRLKYGAEEREKLMRAALKIWVRKCRQRLGRFAYFWVGEPQQDGTLHFHVIVAGKGIVPKQAGVEMVSIWQDFCKMGFAKVKKTYGGARGVAAYLTSYLTKEVYRGLRDRRVYGSNEDFRAAWREKRDAFKAGLPLRTFYKLFKIRYEPDGTKTFHLVWERPGEIDFRSFDDRMQEDLEEQAVDIEFPWEYGGPRRGAQIEWGKKEEVKKYCFTTK